MVSAARTITLDAKGRPALRLGAQPLDGGFSLLEIMFVVGLMGVISAIAIPMAGNELSYLRLSGDARNITNALTLTKMRAAAAFTQARVYMDRNAKSYRIQTWHKANTPPDWVTDGGISYLAGSDQFGFGTVSTAPPDSQATIALAAVCRDRNGDAIADTACVVFNSRGVPIIPRTTGSPNGTESPLGTNVAYVTDGSAVYGTTISAAGMVRLWRTKAAGAANWTLQ
jgi:prepilin-type N-terminal cleavage/methylation domain-containing protein